jgi:hypothetical protein
MIGRDSRRELRRQLDAALSGRALLVGLLVSALAAFASADA